METDSAGRVAKEQLPRKHYMYVCYSLSRVGLFVTLRTVAHQAPLSMGFPRQEYCSGLSFLSPGDFPEPGIEHTSLASPALAGGFFTTSATWEAQMMSTYCSSVGKESACSAGNPGSIPGLGRSPGEGNGNPLQYPCLENLMDRGAWWAAVHGVTKSWA